MSAQTDLLRKIDFFEPLDQKIVSKIAEVCIDREYSKGEYIVKQGESGLGLFFITSGRVKVEIDRNGAKAVVAQLQSEDFLGELSIIDNKPRSANVICLEDTSCLLLTRDSFSRLINKYPEISIQMAKALAGRIRAANEKMGQPLPPSTEVPTSSAAQETPPSSAATQPAANAKPAGQPPAAAPGNGSKPDSSSKDKIKDFLIDTFDFLYTVKAMTRFSAAIVGCPVHLHFEHPGPETVNVEIGEVKLALFPADEKQALKVTAYAEGDFCAAILRPGNAGVARFSGHLTANEFVRLDVPATGDVRLETCPGAETKPS